MSGVADALRAAGALAFGGFLFIVVGGIFASSSALEPMIDLRFWGFIYILVAILLAGGTVYAALVSIFS
ncbi:MULTISPECIES: hypothetical protein [Halobacteriales]|jgi:hypothetical protein|uniref:Uncharacterized protein n=1 Tax=Haloarcula japonica (strain ATCC 49778 / DSM 6131 / JCM 7785 / NBRC 101032 / NCIMB 13157 / TR-1) TaxID=1227453 RepID=M0LEB9_HALJT|nr:MULTISPECIES: hypothetical protein [Halobacteriales]EMA31912.1 hypothetical protein C444_07540 [Haloarcula japonica DSM 6131]